MTPDERADLILKKARMKFELGGQTILWFDMEIAGEILKAIQAERERCAGIAEEHIYTPPNRPGPCGCGLVIAHKIRRGGK